MFCSNNVCSLHRLRYITSFVVYVTAYDLEESFSFNETVEIKSRLSLFLSRLSTP